MVSAALLLAVAIAFLVRFGFDLRAWGLALRQADCFVLSVLVICLPIGLVIDTCCVRWGVTRRWRRALLLVLGVGLGLTPLADPSPVERAIGRPLPPEATLLSSRGFTSAAGGGEQYDFVQFRIGPAAFDALMNQAGFTPADSPDRQDSEMTRRQVESFDTGGQFARPIGSVTTPLFFERDWGGPYDSSSVLYDPATATAHVKRIRG